MAQYLEAVADRPAAAAQHARNIHKLVCGKVHASLEGTETLIICADGWLQQLPFAAMPGKKSRFWIEEMAFAYVPSAQSLVRRVNRPEAKTSGWLLVGDVDFGPALEKERWPRLPGSKREVAAIEALLAGKLGPGDYAKLKGADATRSSVIGGLARRRRFALLATHGFFVSPRDQLGYEIPGVAAELDSALVFAGANTDEAEALLSAEEISSLDLRGLDLLVLSACEGGLGHMTQGQGLIGLMGALDQAGVRTVVSDLWKVPDQETGLLMEKFHQRLLPKEGAPLSVAAALRGAQLEFIAREETREPFFWAAWKVSGHP